MSIGRIIVIVFLKTNLVSIWKGRQK